MKIAIPTESGKVCLHFGRSPKFTICELEDKKIIHKETIDNPGHRTGFLPKYLHDKGVNVVILGGAGRKAEQFFFEYGIQIIIGVSGDVDEVIDKYLKGELNTTDNLCNPSSGKGFGVDKEDDKHAKI